MPTIDLTIEPKATVKSVYGSIAAGITTIDRSVGKLLFQKTWARTPNYQVKLATGTLPMNSYSVYKEETWWGQGHFDSVPLSGATASNIYKADGIPPSLFNVGVGGPPSVSSATRTSVKTRANNKFLENLKNQKLNLAQALAERKRTADLIANSIRRMVEAFRALRRRDLEEALRILGAGKPSRRKMRRIGAIWKGPIRRGSRPSEGEFQNASSVWLEIQYGWRPLLNDIYESAQAIEKAQDHSSKKTRCKGSSAWTDKAVNRYRFNRVDVIDKVNINVRGSYVVWFSLPNSPRTLSQLGFTNPAYLAWELTPFSFVVDWFIPIGNALNSLDSTFGLTFEKGCYSEKIVTSVHRTQSGATTATHRTTGSCVNFQSSHRFTRTGLLDFPMVMMPEFKNPLSFEHAANAIALLVQVFTGKSH
jgi:hypothetical protein